jgi:hypothetical protein
MTGSERRAASRAKLQAKARKERAKVLDAMFRDPNARQVHAGFIALATLLGMLLVTIAQPWR